MSDRTPAAETGATPHSPLEDGYALLVGCILIVVGLFLLKSAGLVTGGIAGIALLISYIVPLPVGVIFAVVNVPFFVFAYFAMGARFVLKTVLVSLGLIVLLGLMPRAIGIAWISPAFAAIAGGTLCGMGILSLARHQAGVGGTGVLTLWLQRTRGINAGRTQVAIDVCILLVSMSVVSLDAVAWSALSAVAMSGVVMVWHRPGRYTGY